MQDFTLQVFFAEGHNPQTPTTRAPPPKAGAPPLLSGWLRPCFGGGLGSPTALEVYFITVECMCFVVANVTCAKAADIVLVLDQSTSIVVETYNNWYVQVLGFAKRIVQAFPIDGNLTQIGLMKFSNDAEIVFHLNTYNDSQSLLNAIDEVRITHGNTNIAAALRTARDVMFTEQNGARPEIPDILILLTDGTANINESQTLPEADLTKAANIKIYTVGVTHEVDVHQLRAMASTRDYYFFASDFAELNNILQNVVENSCKEAAPPPTTTMTTTTITTTATTTTTPTTTTSITTTSTATTPPITTSTTTTSNTTTPTTLSTSSITTDGNTATTTSPATTSGYLS